MKKYQPINTKIIAVILMILSIFTVETSPNLRR